MNAPAESGARPLPRDLTGTDFGRYRVVARIGAGGMGEVYRAEDTVLRRSVALKRLAPHLAADETHKHRLLREARSASALNHPNIAALFDVFEAGGETFLVMELVAGESLRQRLTRPLAVDEALAIVRQCAEALDTAHRRGILHRDIKPENILLSEDGRVKILDFGIAQRLPLDDTGTATTETATLRGTPRYLAPEVFHGRDPDARADIFSLGVVFYEMLTGRHPFEAETLAGAMARILTEDPAPPSQLNRAVLPEVDRIVSKMLARDPAARYASARELLAAIDSLGRPAARKALLTPQLAAVLAAGLVVLAVVVFLSRRPSTPRPSRAMYLAVQPFKPLASDPEIAFFAEGLTEAITTRLQSLEGIYVVPAKTEIGAPLVLEGSVQRSGEQLRITYRLVDRKQNLPLGADFLDGRVADIFTLQDRLAADVGRLLRSQLGLATELAARPPPTGNITAYDFYLQGRGYLRRYETPKNVDLAIDLFQKALAEDSKFALAQAGLGEAYWRKYEATKDAEWVERAVAASKEAAKFDDRLAQVQVTLGLIYQGTGEYEKAVEAFERARVLDPESDDAYRNLGKAYLALGKVAEAEQTYRRAIEVRPEYWAGYNRLGAFYIDQTRYQEATEMFRRVTELTPDNPWGYLNLGAASLYQGQFPGAVVAFEKSIALAPSSDAYSNLATAHIFLGQYANAARMYEKAVELEPRSRKVWGNLGDGYRMMGDSEKARSAYGRAIGLAQEELRVNPRDVDVRRSLALYHARQAARTEALRELKHALELAPTNPEVLYTAARVHNLLGDVEESLRWLERALQRGYSVSKVRADRDFENLHAEPRFRKLVGD